MGHFAGTRIRLRRDRDDAERLRLDPRWVDCVAAEGVYLHLESGLDCARSDSEVLAVGIGRDRRCHRSYPHSQDGGSQYRPHHSPSNRTSYAESISSQRSL